MPGKGHDMEGLRVPGLAKERHGGGGGVGLAVNTFRASKKCSILGRGAGFSL